MKLSEMKQLLAGHQLQLTKSLGQNFLHDANQLHRIAAAAQLHREDKVLEIGPGLGPLTELLLQQAGHVLAIEKDQRLVQLLRFKPWTQELNETLILFDGEDMSRLLQEQLSQRAKARSDFQHLVLAMQLRRSCDAMKLIGVVQEILPKRLRELELMSRQQLLHLGELHSVERDFRPPKRTFFRDAIDEPGPFEIPGFKRPEVRAP